MDALPRRAVARFVWIALAAAIGATEAVPAGPPADRPGLRREGGLRVLTLEGSPYEVGLGHGRALREEIRELVGRWRDDLGRRYEVAPGAAAAAFLSRTDFLPAARRLTPDLLDEVRGIADGAGLDFETVFAYQLIDESWVIEPGPARAKCTSIGAGPRDGSPAFVSQTLDVPGLHHGFPTVLRIRSGRTAGGEVLALTMPGVIGANGLNARGVGVCVNAVTQLAHTTDGLPVAFVIRGLLARGTVDEAERFLREIRPAAPQNYLLGDPGRVACLEASANGVSVVPASKGGLVFHTNHPVTSRDFDPGVLARMTARGETPESLQAACRRFDFLRRAFGAGDAAPDPARLETVYRNRASGINNPSTYACTVMVLGDAPELRVSPGRPDEAPFEVLRFDERAGSVPPAAGARPVTIFPNVDDDDRDGRPDFEAGTLPAGADDELAPASIALPAPLPAGAALRVEVPKAWRGLVRVYVRSGDGTLRPVAGSLPIRAGDVRDGGIGLAIEAGDFAAAGRPRDIDLAVRLVSDDGAAPPPQIVPCRVAPFLVSCCLDPAEAVHVVRTRLTEAFVRDLEPAVRDAGSVPAPFEAPGLPEHDIWIQDATEIGRAAAGGRSMPVALHGNRGLPLDDLFFARFLGPDRGAIRKGRSRGREAEWIDWFGNLEASPPVAAGGREFPRGRVYAGTQAARAMHPDVVAFLDAQGEQGPLLWLDTSWLVIGHVDETVSWVPSAVGRPFRCLVPSPRLALEILAAAERDAPGCVVNRGTRRDGDAPGDYERPVADVLKDAAFTADQALVQGKIDAVRATVRRELGIADEDFVELPVLFGSGMKRFPGRHDAWTPNVVNSLLVGRTLIVPDPHGPLVAGRDVLLQAVKDRLEPLGVRVVPVDNFFPYHRWAGEIHCGTNVTRRPPRA